ncbi:MAG: DUF3297 family protein [Polymorphobacter sp.]
MTEADKPEIDKPEAGDTPATATIADTPPDHLSATPGNKYYDEAVLARGIGIRFNGIERTTVDEYCVSEGWVKLSVGNTRDRYGKPITIKQKGVVEPWFKS